MKTDPIFYRLFKTIPETFFMVLGQSAEQAREMAAHYQFQAVEFKETSHRTDGVFLPKEAGLPLYFMEAQFYPLPSVYADLLAKVYTYLKQHDPGQPYCGVVLFASKSLEPTALVPYQPLLDAGFIRRFYLDEMPEPPNAPLALSIFFLIRQTLSDAPVKARELLARAKTEVGDEARRADLLELIETVIFSKLSHLSWEEVQAMIHLPDIRETRLYKDIEQTVRQDIERAVRDEGKEEGKEEGREEVIAVAVAKMAAKKMSAEEIADNLVLDVDRVRLELAKAARN